MLPLVARPDPAKAALRSRVLAARAAQSPSLRASLGAAIGERLLALPEIVAARTVAGYVGAGTELPTLPWLDALRARGVTVLLPLLRADSSLDWGAYDGVLVDGRLGLREPLVGGLSLSAADVVVVPGVAYDRLGNRLGRGGGSYDRALSSVTALVVGLALDDEVVESVPVESHDRRVDVVVTPTRVLRVTP
jgi:5-formyltetrahydrofolate cyclo-ligase